MNYEFCNKLKMLREKNNISQIEISKILNVSRATYSNYENGITEPSINTIINISKFYNVSIDFLLTNRNNVSNEVINDFNDDVNFEIPKFNKDSILKSLLNKKKKYLKLLESNTLLIKKYISDIDSLISVIQNDINSNNEVTNLENTQLNIDSNKAPYKTEIAEETSPVISLDEYKSSKNSIDVDFYRNNDVKIFTSYSTKRDNKNLVSIPFYGDISCGALKYMSEHMSEYFYLYSNDLRYDESEYFVLQVDGESMNKLYKNGDFLLVKKTSCFDSFNKPYVFYFDDSATLKYIELSEEILRLIPHSTKNYEPKILTFEELQYMQHGVVGTIEGVLNFIED
ncbi:helix-turn-helix domain-containing protein [Paraclostridium sordellii 8483]|uniref:helix-turn-helix domain-containing protein n=1 Tax=Paraclostridium sordellii TaxID=1505 RepID=UPI00102F2122|nr:helix-turn-helix domain-containing protein [Paeniclostridium sordellii]TAN67677.1 helix-turn-helix domain-containing protein [Paeniclostridium sordellii 8483]